MHSIAKIKWKREKLQSTSEYIVKTHNKTAKAAAAMQVGPKNHSQHTITNALLKGMQ